MKITEIKTLINRSIEREKVFIESCKNGDQRDNPQVLEMRYRAEGRLSALQDVHYALKGNLSYLRIWA